MTTEALRKQIVVTDFFETEETICICYQKNGVEKFLPVDKQENKHLRQFVDGEVCQFDCLNIVVEHERMIADQGVMDITKPGGLFEHLGEILKPAI